MHRIKEHIETPSDGYTHQRKHDRLALKDKLHQMILACETHHNPWMLLRI
ncbi:MAG: hypothetical protein ABGY95_07885 [Rubritalea sp.]